MPTPGNLFIGGTTPTWVAYSNDDFLYRVYFDAPATPLASVVDAGFLLGQGRSFAVTSDNALTTEARLAAVFVVDDTVSSGWSDPMDPNSYQGARTRELPQFIQNLFDRTVVDVDGNPYNPSYGDFWIFQSTELERTNGFDNRESALTQFASALAGRGKASNLYETATIALSGVQPQSLIDAAILPDDEEGNRARCSEIVAYLSRDSSRDLLRVADVIAYYEGLPIRTMVDGVYWDHTPETLANFPEAREFVIERWARGFTPIAFLVADGDNNGAGGVGTADVALAATSAWEDDGIAVQALALGTSNAQSGLRSIADATGGRVFLLGTGAENADWDAACDSFLHGGENSLYTAHWGRFFDYPNPTWVREVNAVFSAPTRTDSSGVNSICSVQVRWSKNRRDFTPWLNVPSGTPLIIDDEIVVLEYKVEMRDGWSKSSNGLPLRPSVTSLTHTEITPSRKYFVTLPQPVDGLPVEYLLTANVELPRSARLTWGICRGDSRDFADFEPIRSGRIGMLPNRQYCLQYTDAIVRPNLATEMLDTVGLLYQVLDTDGATAATWASDDIVDVYGNDILLIQSQYSLDADHGIINFLTSTLGATITVTITRPARLYNQVGESTSTQDFRTYYLSNGRFPKDSEAIVLVNGAIRRGGWHINAEDGVVVFSKELESTDIVTVFILSSGLYRVGAELLNYGTSDVTLEEFALFYNAVNNPSLLFELNNTPTPMLIENSLRLMPQPTPNEPTLPTVYERLWVDYQFFSQDGNTESGTTITWWMKRTGETTVWALGEDEDEYHEITADNGLPEYRNRITEMRSHIGPSGGLFLQGDHVRVRVKPSDGFTVGQEYISAAVILSGLRRPYLDPTISLEVISAESTTDAGSGVVYVKAGYKLDAVYSQIDPDGGPDLATVRWYKKDSLQPFLTGKTIPAGTTVAGDVINFIVEPYDGEVTGTTGSSGYVVVR